MPRKNKFTARLRNRACRVERVDYATHGALLELIEAFEALADKQVALDSICDKAQKKMQQAMKAERLARTEAQLDAANRLFDEHEALDNKSDELAHDVEVAERDIDATLDYIKDRIAFAAIRMNDLK